MKARASWIAPAGVSSRPADFCFTAIFEVPDDSIGLETRDPADRQDLVQGLRSWNGGKGWIVSGACDDPNAIGQAQ